MKPPPFLLGAALLFWGWQAEFLAVGAILAVGLESAIFLKVRWEFSDEDFRRLWTFCSVLLLAALVYAFADNEGPAAFGEFFNQPNPRTQGAAGVSSARTAAAMFRWLPMILFPFIAAHAFNSREAIPLTAISWILRRRQLKAKQAGRIPPPDRFFHPGFPYFAACVVGASVHPAENAHFFWGLGALLAWALWSQRSRRFSFVVWAMTLAVAGLLGYVGQQGMWQVQRQLQNLNLQLLVRLRYGRPGSDPAQSITAFGRVGDLKLSSRIVVRLQPQPGSRPPEYLRETAYRTFRMHTWYAGTSRDDFVSVLETPADSGIWPLLPNKTNTSGVRIASFLTGRKDEAHAGLLPLPSGSGRLEHLKAFSVERSSAGAVLASGPGLVIFDALYGPGETMDAPPSKSVTNVTIARVAPGPGPVFMPRSRVTTNPPPNESFTDNDSGKPPIQAPSPERPLLTSRTDGVGATASWFGVTQESRQIVTISNEDLDVPQRETNALDQIIAVLNLKEQSPEQIQRTLAAFFENNFKYRTWQDAPRSRGGDVTPLSRFLLETRAGHCEYFATATTLLLRRCGIPARYAVGYAVHERSGRGYVVRMSDAHAWCLVWDAANQTWRDFDTTPAAWITEEAKRQSAFRGLGDAWSRLRFEWSKIWWGQSQLRQILLWGLLPVLMFLLYRVLFRQRRRANRKEGWGEEYAWPGLDSEFYQLERALTERGVPRKPSETLADWLERAVAAPDLAELREPLQRLLNLHYRLRFDPKGLSPAEREELRLEAGDYLDRLLRARAVNSPSRP